MKTKVAICIILITNLFFACKEKQTLTIAGSETMNQMMVFIGNAYEKNSSDTKVIVEGGGSEAGIDRLRKKQIDIAVSSRDLTPGEFDDLRKTGDLDKIRVAYDGVAVVVNPKNDVVNLHLNQVSDIFSGKITNWKELGGKDLPILTVIRNDKSGTQDYFEDHILRKKDLGITEFEKFKGNQFISSAKIVKNNSEMATFISQNEGAVGYMGMGSAIVDNKDKVKALGYAKKAGDEFVPPSIKNVYDRKYRMARELFAIYKTDQGGKVDAFITYLTSEEGQRAVLQAGYLRATLPEVEVIGEEIPQGEK